MLIKGLRKQEPVLVIKRLLITSDLLSNASTHYTWATWAHSLASCAAPNFPHQLPLSIQSFIPASHTSHTPDSLIYTLKKSKTDQFGESFPIYIFCPNSFLSPYEPLSEYVLSRYANHSSPQEPLFLAENGKMATIWFIKHFQNILSTFGISPEHYSIHLFRIGAATTAASIGILDETIRVHTSVIILLISVKLKPTSAHSNLWVSSSNPAYYLQRRSPHSESPDHPDRRTITSFPFPILFNLSSF